MMLGITPPSDSCSPAPYGQACAGCSRAKCKCFYRPGGSECERCHRLGKVCEPSVAGRKRRRRAASPSPLQAPSRLEEKLDDIVSLLRSQVVERQFQASVPTPQYEPADANTPSVLRTPDSYDHSVSSTTAGQPEVVIDTLTSAIHLLRPGDPQVSLSPLYGDVSVHEVSEDLAEEQLDTFRRAFLKMFPFFHVPETPYASKLRHQKPFLWLVIMSLTTKSVSQQFAMEETIWRIISKRVVAEHLADLDLLLGIVCFAAWSHYFKKDKPFICMLSQLAISLAFDLGVHNDIPIQITQRSKSSRVISQNSPIQRIRTLEERRTILALFHLTSSTWAAYRKTEPLRWTPYMDVCLRILGEGKETPLDIILATQVKCHIITNQLTCVSVYEPVGTESWKAPAVLAVALLKQLSSIRQSLPAHILSENTTQFYLLSAELKIQESLLVGPRASDESGISHSRRLQDLDSVLTSAERWLAVFYKVDLRNFPGISVDFFSQFSHCLVVLFKLVTLNEPGWDTEEVKSRADVFDILDRSCENIDRVPLELGIVDADGPRRGLFFKTKSLLQTIKALFAREMASGSGPVGDLPTPNASASHDNSAVIFSGDNLISEDFILNLSDEPWLSDIFTSTWDFRPDGSVDSSFVP